MSWCIYDLETDGLLKQVTQTFCLVIQDADRVYRFADEGKCSDDVDCSLLDGDIDAGLAQLQTYDLRAGHNILAYDEKVLQKLYDFHVEAEIQDTLILSRMIWPDLKDRDLKRLAKDPSFEKKLIGSHSLGAWGERLRFPKGDFNVVGLTSLSQECLDYCVQDVALNHRLWELERKRMPELEVPS